MSRWDGVFRCETLGVEDCVVWWDAIAAAGAIGAVVATVVLGIFTYRLGSAANRASDAAVKIARNEEKRQKERDKREQTLVLVQINGEVTDNREKLAEIHRQLNGEFAAGYFQVNETYRSEILSKLSVIEFPITSQLTDRLHYLDDPIGPALVRCVAMLRSLQQKSITMGEERDPQKIRTHYWSVCVVTGVMAEDLETIRLACANAIVDSGVDAARIQRAQGVEAEAARADAEENGAS